MAIVNELLNGRKLGPKWENLINSPCVLGCLCRVAQVDFNQCRLHVFKNVELMPGNCWDRNYKTLSNVFTGYR
jgi:hypothetical protein